MPAAVKRRQRPDSHETPKDDSPTPEVPAASTEAQEASSSTPWSPASKIADQQGTNLLLFGNPGCGKTTLGASAVHSALGAPMLIVNFDEEVRSIQDRDDLMVWPGVKQNGKVGSWEKADSFLGKLERSSHPFKTVMFDTLNAAADLALTSVRSRGNPNRDGRQIYGEANDMVLNMVSTWALISREKGINVIYTAHAREVQEGENGPIYIRPDLTPGLLRGIYQKVSAIGYLEDARANRPRKLVLHNTVRVVAKFHQPQSGSRIPDEIKDPDLGKVIDHIRGGTKIKDSDE